MSEQVMGTNLCTNAGAGHLQGTNSQSKRETQWAQHFQKEFFLITLALSSPIDFPQFQILTSWTSRIQCSCTVVSNGTHPGMKVWPCQLKTWGFGQSSLISHILRLSHATFCRLHDLARLGAGVLNHLSIFLHGDWGPGTHWNPMK